MQHSRKAFGTTLAALAAAGLVSVGSAQAASPNHCSYSPSSKIASLSIEPGGGPVQLEMEGNTIVFYDSFGKGNCPSPSGTQLANRDNTASILFSGTASADDFIVSLRGGDFHGSVAGGADPTQIETTVLSDSQDTLDIVGTDSADHIHVIGGNA